MKFLLNTLLLLGVLNLILARSIYWNPYLSHGLEPWPTYDYNDELFAIPSRLNSDEEKDFDLLSKLFDKSSEDSKEPKLLLNTSDETDKDDDIKTLLNTGDETDKDDDIETLGGKSFKELESFLNKIFEDDLSEDKTKIADESKETSNEKDDNNEDNNTAENDNDDNDNSQEQKPIKDKKSSEEKISYDDYLKIGKSSEESYETLVLKKNNDDDGVHENIYPVSQTTKTSVEELDEHIEEISEKDIRELTAILITLSTLDDLIKIAENTSKDEELLDEDLNEKKLKEINNYLSFFGTVLNKIVDESSEVDKDTESSQNNDDNDSKDEEPNNDNDDKDDTDDKDDSKDNDDDNDGQQKNNQKDHDEELNVSFEFHDLEGSKTNLDDQIYSVFYDSTPTVEFQPTSSPYIPETFSTNADNNKVIQEYVEVREKLDTLQDNFLLTKLNMDKNFYNVIANDSDDKNIKNFENDIAVLRENARKIKQSIDDIQDIKSKLYLHKLIKDALKGAQLK